MVKKLLTVALVLFAIAMAVPSTRARIEGEFTSVVDRLKVKLVPSRLEKMANQLDARLGRAERLPTNFDGWLRRDFPGSPADPWDNNYYLQVGRRDYSVGSMGPDGVQGNEDDITVTREYARR